MDNAAHHLKTVLTPAVLSKEFPLAPTMQHDFLPLKYYPKGAVSMVDCNGAPVGRAVTGAWSAPVGMAAVVP